jgi:hypothetical protein
MSEEQVVVESLKVDKTEVLKAMKFHQEEFSKLNDIYKTFKQEDKRAADEKYQTRNFNEFKEQYKFYAKLNVETGEPYAVAIDWEEVWKLISTSFGLEEGYCLGYDITGMPGLVHGNFKTTAHTFSPMIEEESDSRKYWERENTRKNLQRK